MVRRFRHEVRQKLRAKVRGLIASGAWTGISFAAASLLGVAALVEFRAGPVVAGLLGLGLYGFMAYLLPVRVAAIQAEEDSNNNKPVPSADPRVDLLVEAHQHLDALVAAGPGLPMGLREVVASLADDGANIVAAVTDAPEKLNPVLRFFTYYLPATADLVADRLKLAPHAGSERLAEIDQTLGRLSEAFAGFKHATLAPDLASVDIDISLLDDALDADLEELKTK